MAAIAVARVLNALGAFENVDAGAIEGRAEGIGMQRFAPLRIGFLMAMGAVGGRRKCSGVDEFARLSFGIARRANLFFTEAVVENRGDFLGIGVLGRLRAEAAEHPKQAHYTCAHEQGAAPWLTSHPMRPRYLILSLKRLGNRYRERRRRSGERE